MKKFNGDLNVRDHILLFLVTVMTFILPPLLFQPRKNMPSPKIPRKAPAVIAASNTFDPPGLQKQFYYHDPKVFLNGSDAYSFASFRVQEYDPEYLLKKLGGLPDLQRTKAVSYPVGNLPQTGDSVFSAVLREPQNRPKDPVRLPVEKLEYPILFDPSGKPVRECKISLNSNYTSPAKPTKLQVNIPAMKELGGLVYTEVLSSCGNRRMDQLAQKEVNRFLLKNPRLPWQNGGILTVYWGQDMTVAPMPEENETKGNTL